MASLDSVSTNAPDTSRASRAADDRPLVSVIIPAYNAEKTLGDTLCCLRGQTYGNLEILVVDDGSTDGTAAVVAQHAAEDSRIRLLRQPNSGVAAARNLGWKSSSAQFIAFVDADDLWDATKIEKQVNVMLQGGPAMGLVYTRFCHVDEHNRIRHYATTGAISGDVLKEILLENFVGHASSPLLRREALEAVGGFDSSLREAGAHGCEDLKLYQRVAAKFRYGMVPEYLTGYRIAHVRMSSNRLRMLRSFELVAEESRRLHPQMGRHVDAGIRRYLVFLIGEAAAMLDAPECWRLFRLWVRAHPRDAALIPILVLWPKVRRWLKLVARFVQHPLATLAKDRMFPIPQPAAAITTVPESRNLRG